MPRSRDLVDFEHPANAQALAWLDALPRLTACVRSRSPSGADPAQLGAHPDQVEVLWERLGRALPVRCAWIVHGYPVLVHPVPSVLFAFAHGTDEPALRVPTASDEDFAIASPSPAGIVTAARHRCGSDWIVAPSGPERIEWTLAAFDAAAVLARMP